jgi:hypothetical protein
MHNHNKDNCIILKWRINDLGIAFASKVRLGPFWTLIQVLLYRDVPVSSFWHTCTATIRKIYTMMQIKDSINGF